jgi:murein DD-endopeptidase MepM/ murein hydrolase activator NlpD
MALPTAPTTSFGGDTAAQKEYLTALNQVMQSLQAQAEPNLFSLAGALGKPTPTGHWSEALASGASEYGRQQQEQQKLAPNIAQMRASIAGQKYEMQNDAKALSLIGNKLGLSPTETESALSQGNIDKNQINTLQELYPVIAQLSPKRAEMVKQMFSMNVETEKLKTEKDKLFMDVVSKGMDLQKFRAQYGDEAVDNLPQYIKDALVKNTTAPQPEKPTEPVKTQPIDVSKISSLLGSNLTVTSPYGMRIDPISKRETMHNGIDLAGKSGEPLKAIFGGTVINASPVGQYGNTVVVQHDDGHHSYYAHLDKTSVKDGDVIKAGDIIGNLGSTGKSTGPHVEFGIKNPERKSINPFDYSPLQGMLGGKPAQQEGVLVASTDKYAGFPLEVKRDLMKKDIEKIQERMSAIPDMIDAGEKQALIGNQLYNAVAGNEAAFGLLRGDKDLAKGLANFLENGIRVGNFQAGFPIEESLRKNLSPAQQAAVQRVESLLNQISIEQASKMKGSVSNYEDKMVKSVYGTPANSAEFLKYIANRLKIQGQFEQDMANRYYELNKGRPSVSYTDFIMSKETKLMRKNYMDAVEEAAKISASRMGIK